MPKPKTGIDRPTPLPGVIDRPTPKPTPLPGVVDRPSPKDRPQPKPLPGIDRPTTRPTPLPGVDRPTTRPTPLPGRPGGERPPISPPIGTYPTRPGRPDYQRPIVNKPTYVQNNQQYNFVHNQIVNNNYSTYIRPQVGWAPGGIWTGYYPHLHAHWHGGYWGGWYSPPSSFVFGTVFGWLTAGLYQPAPIIYANPYYVAPPTQVIYLNYAQPIPVTSAPVEPLATTVAPIDVPVNVKVRVEQQPAATPADPEKEAAAQAAAVRAIDAARLAFGNGEYAAAQKHCEDAIKFVPSDPASHELRALTLFAQGKFQESAAGVYAVLAAGPGWDWETVRAIYPGIETYTVHLRTLEKHVSANPNDSAAEFLLAYHYLTLGESESALKQLKNVVRLQPKDEVAAALIKVLEAKSPENEKPKPGM